MEHIPKIALIGRPNVGKSTLFNRLTRSKSALVAPTPGLTRDRRYGRIFEPGLVMDLIDTGGLDYSSNQDQIGRMVLEQGLRAIDDADIIVLVLDFREGLTAQDKEIADRLRVCRKPVLTAINKVDSPLQETMLGEFYEIGMGEIIPVSAEHGRNIPDLVEKLAELAALIGFECPRDQPESPGGNMEVSEDEDSARPELQVHPDTPIRVAIIGRPNVGKSSLLNRLLGEPRMIVSDVPGTTRDAIDTLLERYGRRSIIFTDTAGIRRRPKISEKIEKFSVIKAMEAIKSCDIAVVVMDVVEGITDQDKRLISYAEEYKRAVVTIFNKWDLVQNDKALVKLRTEELEFAKRFISYAPHINLSALTGKNVKKLFTTIDSVYENFTVVIGTGRANQALQKAMSLRTPPISKGHFLKLYYTTQVAVAPPTFLVFANYPDLIPGHYLRFLTNQFRKHLDISQVPVHLIFKERERRK